MPSRATFGHELEGSYALGSFGNFQQLNVLVKLSQENFNLVMPSNLFS